MRPQLIMACYGIFTIGLLISMVCSGVWFTGGETGVINQLAGFSVLHLSSTITGLPTQLTSWFDALVTMVSWSYPYLDNVVGLIIKLVILYPVTMGVVVSVVQLFISVFQYSWTAIRGILTSI